MDKNILFQKFLETCDILVVDKNPFSRKRLSEVLVELGAFSHRIYVASGVSDAEKIIKTKNISMVFSDYSIEGALAFDLFKMVRENFPHSKKLTQILITSNISQIAVARASEADVDTFMIKPYTLDGLRENLVPVIASKVQPSDYIKKIDIAKNAISDMRLDQAMAHLREACELNPAPTLAIYYLGQIAFMRKMDQEAMGLFERGLGHNPIHTRSLVGIFEILMQQKKYDKAYEMVKKISKYFPANPDRISQIIRLAIQTENFTDIIMYYETFVKLDERNPLMVNHIGAGLFVAGKYFLRKNRKKEALRIFDAIANSCVEYTKFMRASVAALVEYNLGDHAEKYLSQFPSESLEDEDFMVARFLVHSQVGGDKLSALEEGWELYRKNIKDADCLRAIIKLMEQTGHLESEIFLYRSELSELTASKFAA
jgi:CheY-like chemotaxis protein